ncbi:hypothetical protein [Georgenia sp. AZ-5]|uniref:hypothetical protein n=1 Tax=Georgenia sp. AZ-5 TaxID=3367526 RepID=UPI003753F071
MNTADLIWNRAVRFDDMSSFREGDQALHDVSQLTGLADNGGLLHAVGVLGPADLRAAVAGLRWLGLDSLANMIEAFALEAGDPDSLPLELAEELEERGNDLYYGADPDAAVESAFRMRLAEKPDAFAPLH